MNAVRFTLAELADTRPLPCGGEHLRSEDCMTCRHCETCREDLDEHEICRDCYKQANKGVQASLVELAPDTGKRPARRSA